MNRVWDSGGDSGGDSGVHNNYMENTLAPKEGKPLDQPIHKT